MKYIDKHRRKGLLLLGAVAMIMCGASDCLLSFMGEGEPYAVGEIVSMNITDVPLWFYQVSFIIGIIAAAGYYLAACCVWSHTYDRLGGEPTTPLKAYSLGTTMMSLGIFGIHSICCLALMNVRAAVLTGADAADIEKYFTPSALHPFIVGTAWQTLADIISGTAFIILVCKGVIGIRKAWIAIGPLSLYVICQLLGTVLTNATGYTLFKHCLAGGESWGIAFMFLSVWSVSGRNDKAE